MRQHSGGMDVTALATWASPPGRRRRSVHRSAKMASRRRFGAFVYTVGPWAWVVGGLGIAIVYTNGRIGPLGTVLGHLCTLLRRESRYESRRELRQVARAPQPPWRAGGAPLAGPSRLVGKTDSERVAPLPGWHLRQGVNPHEPLKSQKWDLFKVERTVASTPAYLHEHMEFHRFNPNATEICIFLCHDQVPVQ